MKDHLNPDAIDRHLAGVRDVAAENHLRECAECRDAVAGMATTLRRFRVSAQAWSESLPLARPVAPPDASPSRWWVAPVRWAAVATVALALAALPIYQDYSRHQAAAKARADALLLEQVSADLSRPAPEALEPLIELVSSQSNTGDNR